ncbi:MAG: hypothetical protein QOC76_4854 [Mycobacterium sp.]|nr:hypothetical protein [Mycobacterium sp.]
MLQEATPLGSGGGARILAPTAFIAVKQDQIPRPPKRRRVVVAWIVAAGVGLSAALYPLPSGLQLLKLFPPEAQATEPSQMEFGSGKLKVLAAADLTAFNGAEISDLVALIGLLDNFPELPVDTLLDVVETYGLPGAVTLLGSLLPSLPVNSGGGFALAPSGGGSTSVLPVLVRLLEYLKHAPPIAVGALSAVVTDVLPAVLQSLGISLAPAPTVAQEEVNEVPEASSAALAVAPNPDPPEALASTAPEHSASAPTPDPSSAPTPEPQPAHPQVVQVAESTSSASAVTNDGLLSSESSSNSAGVGSTSGALNGMSAGASNESTAGGGGSGGSTSVSADPGGDGSAGGSTTGGDGSGGAESTGSPGSGGE